jgi:hypothetical protein
MGTKTTTPRISLNTQEPSSVKLPTYPHRCFRYIWCIINPCRNYHFRQKMSPAHLPSHADQPNTHALVMDTNSMEQEGPYWDASSPSAIQYTSHLLWNQKEGPPSVPILIRRNSVHSLLPYLLWIQITIILPSTTTYVVQVVSPCTFWNQNLVCISHLSNAIPFHSRCFDELICFVKSTYKLWSSSLCGSLHHVISSLSGPHILLRTMFSNILSVGFSLNSRDQVWHTYKGQVI